MKRTVRILTGLLAVTALLWSLLPLMRRDEEAPTPVDRTATAVPDTTPFTLLLVLTDEETTAGILAVTFEREAVTIMAVPANARLTVGAKFLQADRLQEPALRERLLTALEKQLEITIDNYLILGYDSCIRLLQEHVGGVTLELTEDVPIPFIGDTLILPKGRQTLTPAQTAAYWRQSPDTVTRVERQAQVLAVLLENWLTPAHRPQWDTLFEDLVNTAVTDWRIDRYTIQRRLLSVLSARESPVPTTYVIPDGELVGEGVHHRFEFADTPAQKEPVL